jgi:hypothetical protein
MVPKVLDYFERVNHQIKNEDKLSDFGFVDEKYVSVEEIIVSNVLILLFQKNLNLTPDS